MLNIIAGKADASNAEGIGTTSHTSELDTVVIDGFHFVRHTEPERAAGMSFIVSSADDTAVVKPPAVTDDALTHVLKGES